MSVMKIEGIVVHHSDSDFGDRDIIKEWHLMNGWKDIGYNLIILNGNIKYNEPYQPVYDGKTQEGRALNFNSYVDENEIAAHTLGYNKNYIGVCLIGKNEFTLSQYNTLFHVIKIFQSINPDIKIKGHYEMPTANGKTCPNIDMQILRTIYKSIIFDTDSVLEKLPVRRI